jgi:Flp pilus assembly protein TadD
LIVPGLPASRMLALENRLALPAIAIVILAAEVAARVSWPRAACLAAGGSLVAALAAVTVWYAGDFRDRLSFAQAAVRGSPHAAIAHRNLGITYHLAGETALARQEYEAAIAEDTAEPVVHNNLAVLLMAEGRLPQAEVELRAELAVNPGYAAAHANLARVLAALGRGEEAAKERALAEGSR